jgi:hypothetical protein
MKNLLILILFVGIISCSSEDDNTPPSINQEYLDQLLGWYEIKAMYANDSVDLNGDGLAGTDIFEEVEYCNMSTILNSYRCTIVDKGNYPRLRFYAPFSDWSNVEQNYTHCLKHADLATRIIIDTRNEIIMLDTQDYEFEFMFEVKKTKILDLRWEDRVIYLTLEQQLIMPTDEWKTVIMNLEYEWVRSET